MNGTIVSASAFERAELYGSRIGVNKVMTRVDIGPFVSRGVRATVTFRTLASSDPERRVYMPGLQITNGRGARYSMEPSTSATATALARKTFDESCAYLYWDLAQAHDEVPRFFMLKRPQRENGSLLDVTHDYQSLCRTEDQSFVHREIEVPLIGAPETPMGFICWVQVTAEDYRRLLVFRTHEGSVALLDDIVGGTLANRIPGVSDSFGTPVKFKVLAGDPTPYVRWLEPGTPLAEFVEAGATLAFCMGSRHGAERERWTCAQRVCPLVLIFRALVRTDDFHAFVTAEGDCRGLFVPRRNSTGFEVREGQSGSSISYRIVASITSSRRAALPGACKRA